METNGNKQQNVMSGAGGHLHRGESWTGSPHNPKEIPTVASTAKYCGDYKTVATQAQTKVPDNPDEVIARNTKQTVCSCPCCK